MKVSVTYLLCALVTFSDAVEILKTKIDYGSSLDVDQIEIEKVGKGKGKINTRNALSPGINGLSTTRVNEQLDELNVYLPRNVSSIFIVGNGRSQLGKGLGKLIEKSDVVGRFNYFKTKHYEADVGKRTDIWFRGLKRSSAETTRKGLRRQVWVIPKYACIVPIHLHGHMSCNNIINRCTVNEEDYQRRMSQAQDLTAQYKDKVLGKKLIIMPLSVQISLVTKYGYPSSNLASTGMLALIFCLETWPEARIMISGYDFTQQRLGHYWEKRTKKGTSHSMRDEAKLLNRLSMQGRIKIM